MKARDIPCPVCTSPPGVQCIPVRSGPVTQDTDCPVCHVRAGVKCLGRGGIHADRREWDGLEPGMTHRERSAEAARLTAGVSVPVDRKEVERLYAEREKAWKALEDAVREGKV
jgi:hypothetical protein